MDLEAHGDRIFAANQISRRIYNLCVRAGMSLREMPSWDGNGGTPHELREHTLFLWTDQCSSARMVPDAFLTEYGQYARQVDGILREMVEELRRGDQNDSNAA